MVSSSPIKENDVVKLSATEGRKKHIVVESGPLVVNVIKNPNSLLAAVYNVAAKLDWLPDFGEEKLEILQETDVQHTHGHRPLAGLINASLRR